MKASVIDTTIPEEVRDFVNTVRGYGEEDGPAFTVIINRLPNTVNSLGVSGTKQRIVRTLKRLEYLPPGFKDNVSRYTKRQIKDYNGKQVELIVLY